VPVRLLLVLVILAILSGCEQTSLLPEEAEKQVGVERAESVPQVVRARCLGPRTASSDRGDGACR
jgi:hypothetical protein